MPVLSAPRKSASRLEPARNRRDVGLVAESPSLATRQPSENESSRLTLSEAYFRAAVHRGLRNLTGGLITVSDSEGTTTFGDHQSQLTATIEVVDARFYRTIALGGSIGAGESYRDGFWKCDDLTSLIQIFARNMQESSQLGGFWNAILDLGRRVTHGWNRNTRSGSRRNIAAHYDLSNEFYSLFLDDTMTYSSGIFPNRQSTMKEASIEKYDQICRKLDLSAGDEVLEIGTGWGGFAIHAVKNYGCHVTTTTISKQQHDFAKKRFSEEGLDSKVRLLQSDYRDLTGHYDKLVSIEMIEAVGHQYFDTYFAKCGELLKSGGQFAMQAITIPDQRYAQYLKSVDFIQKYIFPGGCLPSVGAITDSIGRVSDMQLTDMKDFKEHYARTLECWRLKFFDNIEGIAGLGMSESFLRLWEYYFCYCEGAFRENQIGVSHFVFRQSR